MRHRTLRVARLQALHWPVMVCGPWAIVASSFAINLAIISVLNEDARSGFTTGGIFALYIPIFYVFFALMTQWLPFAMSLGVTRRRFFAGSLLLAGGLAAANGTALLVLRALEHATGGWWFGMEFFEPGVLAYGGVAQLAVYALPMLGGSTFGMLVGTVRMRWGQNGMFVATVLSILVIGGAAFVLTWRQLWPALGEWITGQSLLTLWGGGALVVALASAAGTYACLRRAAPG